MKPTKPKISHEDLFLYISLLLTASMFFSRFLTSLAMGLLVLLAFVRIDLKPFRIRPGHSILEIIRRTYTHPVYAALSLLFWVPLISGLWTEDLGDWARVVRIRLPFLILPLAFASLDKWPKYAGKYIAATAIGTAIATIPFVLYYFMTDAHAVLESLEHGRMLWTPAYHIRYSLLVSYSTLLAFYYGWKEAEKRRKWFWWAAGAVLLVFLHFLAVRSGLFVFYAIALFVLLYEMVTGKHRLKMAGVFLLLVLLPVIGVKTVPSLQQKWKYMRWDLEEIAKGKINEGSDNLRLLSFKGGISIFRENPVLGVGVGDLKQKMKDYFVKKQLPFELKRL